MTQIIKAVQQILIIKIKIVKKIRPQQLKCNKTSKTILKINQVQINKINLIILLNRMRISSNQTKHKIIMDKKNDDEQMNI